MMGMNVDINAVINRLSQRIAQLEVDLAVTREALKQYEDREGVMVTPPEEGTPVDV